MKSINLLVYAIFLLCVSIEAGIIEYNVIEDLTYPIDENTVYWAPDETFKLNVSVATEIPDVGWIAANTFYSAEHGGTHIDAPYHFNKDGWKVGEIPIRNFIKQGVLIDVKDKVKDDKSFRLSVHDIKEWEAINGEIPENSVVLISFGWSRFYPNRLSYLGTINPPYNFPSIGKEAGQYIAAKKVIGVGLDVASVDPAEVADNHRTFAAHNIYNLENVALATSRLPPKGFQLVVLPMKISKGTGGPVRIVALY